jgi:peroxiredoxin
LVRDLAASGLASSSLQAGSRLPEFELPNIEGRLIASDELRQKGPLVISFCRGG